MRGGWHKKITALTTKQYKEITTTMKGGFCGCRPNERIATALVLEGNPSLRISTHSFRKWYATELYKANGYDIALVQLLLQNSSDVVTQRYIGIKLQRIEKVIEENVKLI